MATFSLCKAMYAPSDVLIACHWRSTGDALAAQAMGVGDMGGPGDLVFALTAQPVQNAMCSAQVPLPEGPALLRLDEVAFPQGAIAYRHIHPGPGIRTLVQGGLRLISDHDTQIVAPGDSWFEAANAPVRAENTHEGLSRFVRAMILPVALAGQPSINILSAEDRGQPRLQVTHRLVDHVFIL